ncbi:peroxiredoxin [Candidatus Saccharibacteria bacterium]|nr:MAG: peroxiredoxin [Candidatus Saccharibacteria bacterium]
MSQRLLSQPAPDFSLVNQSDEQVGLKDFRGSWLVLYFYPKDDTPSCTTEACSIRDVWDELTEMGVNVVGVSMDTPADHLKFKAKYNLNFTLLSDPRREVIDTYDAWGKKMFGREGILRKTYLIDPKGTIRKIYGRVTSDGHGTQLFEDLVALQEQDA